MTATIDSSAFGPLYITDETGICKTYEAVSVLQGGEDSGSFTLEKKLVPRLIEILQEAVKEK